MSIESFLKDFTDQIQDNRAALFVGAGISTDSGFVDWKHLLKPIAEEIGLDVEREHDYPMLAQQYLNAKGTRNLLVSHIVKALNIPASPNTYHDIITELPIREIWTSNFDQLLEDAYRKKGKRCDVRTRDDSFLTPRPSSDVTIYKMHGDSSDPTNLVITQSDYAQYDEKYHLMAMKLEAELSERTFLFIGFSLEDPNFNHIIERNEGRFGQNVHRHYAVLKPPSGDYELRKFDHFELYAKTLGIQIIRIGDYGELLPLLRKIRNASPRMPQILAGQEQRNRFIVRKLEEVAARRNDASVYICAVFSSFAISDDEEYVKYEPVKTPEHIALILQEKEYLERIAAMKNTRVRVLLCPPPNFEAKNEIRYRNLLAWLRKNKGRPNIEVKCTSLNYYDNILLVDDEFCLAASYSEIAGYDENRVYYDKDSISRRKAAFLDRFEKPLIARDVNAAIRYYETLLANNSGLAEHISGEKWDTVGTRLVYAWKDFRLIEANVKIGEKDIVYSWVDHPGSIIILPVTKEGKLVLVTQFRYLLRTSSIELPGGAIDKDEDWKSAAIRELAEETGYRPRDVALIGKFFTSNAITNEMVQVVLATDVEFVAKTTPVSESEETDCMEWPLAVVNEKIASGEIADGPTISAMQIFSLHMSGRTGE